MKKAFLFMSAIALVLVAGSARGRELSLGVGQYYFSDSYVRDTFGSSSFGFNARCSLGTNTSLEFLAAQFHNKVTVFGTSYDQYNGFCSLMLDVHSKQYPDNEAAGKMYGGLGLGLTQIDLNPDTSQSSSQGVAWQAYAGINIGKRFFLEAKYVNGGSDRLITSYSLAVGTRFLWHRK